MKPLIQSILLITILTSTLAHAQESKEDKARKQSKKSLLVAEVSGGVAAVSTYNYLQDIRPDRAALFNQRMYGPENSYLAPGQEFKKISNAREYINYVNPKKESVRIIMSTAKPYDIHEITYESSLGKSVVIVGESSKKELQASIKTALSKIENPGARVTRFRVERFTSKQRFFIKTAPLWEKISIFSFMLSSASAAYGLIKSEEAGSNSKSAALIDSPRSVVEKNFSARSGTSTSVQGQQL